jgi:urease accessory protein
MQNRNCSQVVTRAALALALLVAAGSSVALAHHPMGSTTPTTFLHGLLSGFGHPILGIDHLAFIVAMGIAVGIAGLHLALPAAFAAFSIVGVALHVAGVGLPGAEIVVAASVLLIGALIAFGSQMPAAGWAGLFAFAGLFHGHAFGEAVVGAEPTPIAAYLAGLSVTQMAIAVAVAIAARRVTSGPVPRLAGGAIAVVGLVVLAGHAMPS